MKMHRLWTVLVLALLASCGDGIGSGGGSASVGSTDNDALQNDNEDPVVTTPNIPVVTTGLNLLSYKDNGDNSVDVVFRAVKSDGEGLSGLEASDFKITENGTTLSAESQFYLDREQWLSFSHEIRILVDVSSSMTQLASVRSALRSLLVEQNTLDTRQAVTLASFDDTVVNHLAVPTRLASSIDTALSGVASRGVNSTDLNGAIETYARTLRQSYQSGNLRFKSLIVITDGEDSASRVTLAEALSAIGTDTVYMVNLGEHAESLQLLGTGGYYANQDVYSAMRTVMQDIEAYENSHYELHHFSAKRASQSGSSSHKLGIGLDGTTISVEFLASSRSSQASRLEITPITEANLNDSVTLAARLVPPQAGVEGELTWYVNNDVCGIEQYGSGLETQAALLFFRSGECSVTAKYMPYGSVEPFHINQVITVH